MVARRGFNFPDAFQSKVIAAGSSAKVFEFRVPAGGTAFISAVGITLPNSSCSWKWFVDGSPVEQKSSYQVGEINAPKEFNPPIVSERDITVYGFNDGTSDDTFEIRIEGFYYVEDTL